MAKTLITGATGGLGNAVANFLKEKTGTENIAVLVRDKNSEQAKNFAQLGMDIRVADYSDQDALTTAFAGIDVLYFVSANDLEKRLDQHQNVVSAAKSADIQHILYTSTVRKDESAASPLHIVVNAHVQTELLIKESGITYTILRHNLYNEVIAMFLGEKSQLVQSKTVYLPTGTGKTAFVTRNDFAEAEANILADPKTHENKIYEFNGSEEVTLAQVAAILSDVTGEQILYVSPQVEEFKTTLASYGLPGGIIDMVTMFSLGISNGEFDQQSTDLENILGRKTQPVGEFLQEVYG
jgi:NAD(P)H dehydrogenase (quinone)